MLVIFPNELCACDIILRTFLPFVNFRNFFSFECVLFVVRGRFKLGDIFESGDVLNF